MNGVSVSWKCSNWLQNASSFCRKQSLPIQDRANAQSEPRLVDFPEGKWWQRHKLTWIVPSRWLLCLIKSGLRAPQTSHPSIHPSTIHHPSPSIFDLSPRGRMGRKEALHLLLLFGNLYNRSSLSLRQMRYIDRSWFAKWRLNWGSNSRFSWVHGQLIIILAQSQCRTRTVDSQSVHFQHLTLLKVKTKL